MILESVNFHFWPYCNFKCIYCFTRFLNIQKQLSKEEYRVIIKELAKNGTKKINFVGGEPTLCPYLGELIEFSKNLNMIIGLVSNGTGITKKFIAQYGKKIDWIGLSLDSGIESIQRMLGRGNSNYVRSIITKGRMIKKTNIKLKINTVVTRLNYKEDMSKIIKKINPIRWKVFQVLPIEGQNDKNMKCLEISKIDFMYFINRHIQLNPIAEDNNAMIESYTMIDSMGRFYQNTRNRYVFSRPILKVGASSAFNDIHYNHKKFLQRGGIYVW